VCGVVTEICPTGRRVCDKGLPCVHTQDPPNLTYLLDIIEQGGEHMVRSAYWDCGDWSDLWQACRVRGAQEGWGGVGCARDAKHEAAAASSPSQQTKPSHACKGARILSCTSAPAHARSLCPMEHMT